MALQSLKILLYFCIACGNCYHFRPKCGSNFRTQYKSIHNLRILEGYIFRILQRNFAILLILVCSFREYILFCQDKILVYNGNRSISGRPFSPPPPPPPPPFCRPWQAGTSVRVYEQYIILIILFSSYRKIRKFQFWFIKE
jgi:hypothetical protein